jgi:hypothetical protein
LLDHPKQKARRGGGLRVGNFREKNNSAEDGIDETNGYFRRNSGCSEEQKALRIPFRTLLRNSVPLSKNRRPFSGTENNSEFLSVVPK